jgi:diguanylate cyclase
MEEIQDTYGKLAGEELLLSVARILRASTREYDLVARLQDAEFGILIPEATPHQVYEHIEEIRKRVEKAEFGVSTTNAPVKATLSFGIAGREEMGQPPREILRCSDQALYWARQAGCNCTEIFFRVEAPEPVLP